MRKFYILLLMIFLFSTNFLLSVVIDSTNTIRGKIIINNKQFTYIQSLFKIDVYSENNTNVFHSESNDSYENILHFGYSSRLESFYTFKQQLDNKSNIFKLILETKETQYIVVEKSISSFYTPILIDYVNPYICFITENHSIVIVNLNSGKIIKTINFTLPILKLEKLKTKDDIQIKFLAFSNGTYKTRYIGFESIVNSVNPKISVIDNLKTAETPFFQKTPIIIKPLSLNYKKFLCFGDSITYGYINKEPAQELGYVPRLYKMITDNLYDAYLINEGYPGTLTHEAVDIFDNVIKNHNAKYLLFHYGTNDAIHTEIPVSNVIYNIKYMVEASVRYGMYPIISTLIPRNGWTGIGILRNRAMQINEGIRELSESLQIPIIDFWDLFSLFPDEEGGYLSLMSDNVHPSENGYQLMALNWYEHIKNIAPSIPTNIHTVAKTGTEIKLAWDDNIAEDFSHWVIEFSFFNKNFGYSYTTTINSYEFKINPFSNGILYFRIKAVNNNQVSSEFSDIIEIKLRD